MGLGVYSASVSLALGNSPNNSSPELEGMIGTPQTAVILGKRLGCLKPLSKIDTNRC